MSGLGIDLGTANTVMCRHNRGIVLDEPSVMVVRAADRGKRVRPLLAGRAARELVGRCPPGITVLHPLQDGVVIDLEAARAYLAAVLPAVVGHGLFRSRPRAVIAVPAGATALERRALLEAADEVGLRRTRLVAEPIAAAVGCGIDPLEPRAHMIVDIGGGTAEITAFILGGVLSHRSCRVAGDELTLALYQYLRSEHHLVVGEVTAEGIKCRLSDETNYSLVARGLDAASGRPRLATLGVDEVLDALRPTVTTIVTTLAQSLEDLPPEAVNDIFDEGLWTVGGGTLLRGFDKVLQDVVGFSVRPASNPLTCVAEGAAACLSHPDVLAAYDAATVVTG